METNKQTKNNFKTTMLDIGIMMVCVLLLKSIRVFPIISFQMIGDGHWH